MNSPEQNENNNAPHDVDVIDNIIGNIIDSNNTNESTNENRLNDELLDELVDVLMNDINDELINEVNNESDNENNENNENNESDNTSETQFIPTPDRPCVHYSRKCKIIASCCNKVYPCRLCHDQSLLLEPLSNNNNEDNTDSHKHKHKQCPQLNFNRHLIKKVVCNMCNLEQDVQQYCTNCNTCFGRYFCNRCNLFDDMDKGQYHCDDCGMCRTGGKENNFHCHSCNMCLSLLIKSTHKCLNRQNITCPICIEDIFTSVRPNQIMKCGHSIHTDCLKELVKQTSYKCPLCNVSLFDMSTFNESLDREIALTIMPADYASVKLDILCNDCHRESNVKFHIIGHKCLNCGSYNTRKI
jgi:RING finger/CHY zinc finger protein 1